MNIVARMYPSVYYLWSAEHHARLAVEIEQEHSGASTGSVRHRAYVISSVTDAVAFMESVVNEVIQDAVDNITADSPDIHIRAIPHAARQRLFGYWIAGERSGILDKYNHALKLADKATLDYGSEPTQSASVLIALRNYFIHHKPENISISLDPPRLATRLQGRFPDNALMAGAANPWFPDHAMGAGCARWSHVTARSFVDNWASLLGLTSLPYQNPGWEEMP
jgi:hypothetical protein